MCAIIFSTENPTMLVEDLHYEESWCEPGEMLEFSTYLFAGKVIDFKDYTKLIKEGYKSVTFSNFNW